MKETKTEYSNYFMAEVESKYMGRNPFKKLACYIKHKRFIKKIRNWSPSIGVLWFFADFIRIAERVYFFDNRKDGALFSSSSYSYGENGFIITSHDDNVKLTCKIYSDDQKVIIEIKRLNGSNLITEHSFQNNEWSYDSDRSIYDEVLIDNAIGIINRSMIELVEYCWNHKGSYDYPV